MALWDAVTRILALTPEMAESPPLKTRDFDDHPGLDVQLEAIRSLRTRPWRAAGLREALGVPAIHRAVTLIANTGGALSLNGYRNGLRLEDMDRPRLIIRPNPFTTPRDFFRDTFYSMATRGEAWWWVAARDTDDSPLSLVPVNPAEVSVTEDPRDLRFPKIQWRGRTMRNEDMRQVTLMRELGSLRGYGPLQMCGAAVSVAVESQEWAANFFAYGGYPSIWIKAAGDLSGGDDGEDADALSEAERLKAQWIDVAPNTPRVTDDGIEDIKQFDPNPQGSQMLSSRDYQNGEAARMFGIPGSLLDYNTSGSSLTYQNLEQEMTKFLRTCLWPNYLEPVEQALSDLLTRSTVARFNVDAVNRADAKTRAEVYNLLIPQGVLTPEQAQAQEGLIPGDIETAPVPLSMPAAIPSILPIQQRSREVRCAGTLVLRGRVQTCGRLLGDLTPPYRTVCPRCKTEAAA